MALADLKLPPVTYHKAAHYTLGRAGKVIAFVNHRMVGTLAGTTAYFANPDTRAVSTHFGIGVINGAVAIHQYVPLDDTAYGNGNYDASGSWDNWGYPLTNINARTISIEHQDHWGDDTIKGIVKPEVQVASQKLQALLRWGSIAEWKAAGLVFRDWANATIIRAELDAIPVDARHIITHKDIAGSLKPYCWAPWMADKIGFPRAAYVTGIDMTYKNQLRYVAPPPTPATVTVTLTTADLQGRIDAAFLAGATSRDGEVTALKSQIVTLQAQVTTLQTQSAALLGENTKLKQKLLDIRAILDRA